jgi:hypothetical protein
MSFFQNLNLPVNITHHLGAAQALTPATQKRKSKSLRGFDVAGLDIGG